MKQKLLIFPVLFLLGIMLCSCAALREKGYPTIIPEGKPLPGNNPGVFQELDLKKAEEGQFSGRQSTVVINKEIKNETNIDLSIKDTILIAKRGPVTWEALERLEARVSSNENKISQLRGATKELAIRTYMFEEKYIPYYIGTFNSNSSKLNQKLEEQINRVLVVVDKMNLRLVEIYGFADVLGIEQKNIKLSLERAQAVADYLRTKCIKNQPLNISDLDIQGKGEAKKFGFYIDNHSVIIICVKN